MLKMISPIEEAPACKFLLARYTGNDDGIATAINQLVSRILSAGQSVDLKCGIRIHHLNSPDDTAVAKLQHIVYVSLVDAPFKHS